VRARRRNAPHWRYRLGLEKTGASWSGKNARSFGWFFASMPVTTPPLITAAEL
jgi:hypothetical protein